MTSLIEKMVAIIAPHYCILCGIENNMLCDNCLLQLADDTHSICYLCEIETSDGAVCYTCSKQTALQHVWLGGNYDKELSYLIKKFKFGRAQAAARPLARLIAEQLPQLPAQTIIVPIPTSSARVRQRGYDQSLLLAKEIGRLTSLCVSPLLARKGSFRQVGASRSQRFAQARQSFFVANAQKCQGATILLVDDVTTSGATLSAAAEILHEAGAASINAAAVAKQRLK
ncbi:MAG TPA: phosphoribosyltransferase family protein [Candidatus Acidoferrum sp.]|nr:phosphoribosyltransferase family protein [Candidatus Acidoferrum sp.]